MNEGAIGWIELPGGSDCEAMGFFYANAFDWSVEVRDGTTSFQIPHTDVRGAFIGDLATGSGGPILYLLTTDAAAALVRVVEAGGSAVTERTEIAPGVGFRGLFLDPAGTVMGLFEPATGG